MICEWTSVVQAAELYLSTPEITFGFAVVIYKPSTYTFRFIRERYLNIKRGGMPLGLGYVGYPQAILKFHRASQWYNRITMYAVGDE